jgi:hypothetical protein
MKWKGYIYLKELTEPEENSLRILIDWCYVKKTDTLNREK